MNLPPWPGVWNVPIDITQVMGPTQGTWGAISFPEPQGSMKLELGERERGHQQVSMVSGPSERRLGDGPPESQEENQQTTMVI